MLILKSQLNVLESVHLESIKCLRVLLSLRADYNTRPLYMSTPRSQKYQKPIINTPQVVDNNSQVFYNSSITPWSTLMSVSYQSAQKQHVRITLDLSVLSDFNARDIDFSKLFELEPSESVEVYIEEFDRY